nr:uncharacterized protein LOC117849179 [Setaria viridis]
MRRTPACATPPPSPSCRRDSHHLPHPRGATTHACRPLPPSSIIHRQPPPPPSSPAAAAISLELILFGLCLRHHLIQRIRRMLPLSWAFLVRFLKKELLMLEIWIKGEESQPQESNT